MAVSSSCEPTLELLYASQIGKINDGIYGFLVVLDGAFFFFMLMGWHAPMGDHPVDDANWWLNWSIQVLCGLFTYGALWTMPWRIAHLVHLCGPQAAPGLDFHGYPTADHWFGLPVRVRAIALALLWANTLFQFANQAARIIYPNHEESAAMPGVVFCNVFFGLSFACSFAAAGYLYRSIKLLGREDPQRFGEESAFKVLLSLGRVLAVVRVLSIRSGPESCPGTSCRSTRLSRQHDGTARESLDVREMSNKI